MDAAGDIFSALAQAVLELVIRLLQLLFFVVENIVYGVLWLCRCTKFAGPRRLRKLPEETRHLIRSCLHTTLALSLLSVTLYFAWPQMPAEPEPAASPPPPQTKIEKAQKMIEKAWQIKEALLPPKPRP